MEQAVKLTVNPRMREGASSQVSREEQS